MLQNREFKKKNQIMVINEDEIHRVKRNKQKINKYELMY